MQSLTRAAITCKPEFSVNQTCFARRRKEPQSAQSKMQPLRFFASSRENHLLKLEQRIIMKLTALLLLIVMLGLPTAYSNAEDADMVLKNGNVYTVNERQPHAEAIAVKGGKIIFVGDGFRM